MKFTIAAALVVAAVAPLSAQTPAPSPATPRHPSQAAQPGARAARPAPDSQARFVAIRQKFQKELDTERAALQRTRDRMREELTAAGWRPRRRFDAGARMRSARFRFRRAPQPRMMMHGAMLPPGRRGGAMFGPGQMPGMRGRAMQPRPMMPQSPTAPGSPMMRRRPMTPTPPDSTQHGVN